MVDDRSEEMTRLLNRAAQGDDDAARRVFPVIYRELHGLASQRRRRLPAGATLQTTALVHEAYERIVRRHPTGWESLRHFYFTAARAMRDILVEAARRKLRRKRGGGAEIVPEADARWIYASPPEDILALDAALKRLEAEDEEGYRLISLKFYAGLTLTEIAGVLGTSLRSTERRWRFLRVWLMRELAEPSTAPPTA